MKGLILFLIAFSFGQSAHAQRPFTGIDLGYQAGNEHYFEAGLNISKRLKNRILGELSVGIEDNLNANVLGYKIGLMAYNGASRRTVGTDAKPIPIIAGVSFISYNISDETVNAFRPEIGIRTIYRHGQGLTTAKLSYGYNFIDGEHPSPLNKHLIRISFNTYWRSFFDIFGYIFQ